VNEAVIDHNVVAAPAETPAPNRPSPAPAAAEYNPIGMPYRIPSKRPLHTEGKTNSRTDSKAAGPRSRQDRNWAGRSLAGWRAGIMISGCPLSLVVVTVCCGVEDNFPACCALGPHALHGIHHVGLLA